MKYIIHVFLLCGYAIVSAFASVMFSPLWGDVTEVSILIGEAIGLTLWTLYLIGEGDIGAEKPVIYSFILSAYAGLLVAYSWLQYGKAAMIYESIGWILLSGAILRLISIWWGERDDTFTPPAFVIIWVITSVGVATVTAYIPHTLYNAVTTPL